MNYIYMATPRENDYLNQAHNGLCYSATQEPTVEAAAD